MTNDMQIQHDVVAELGQEQNVVAGTIGVEVHHGVVKLAGHVSDQGTLQRAERAAHRVDGVTTVVLDIDVAGAATQAMVI
jgi:osmotically-inducible protein OsmY